MGDSMQITSILFAVLFLASFGFYQDSFAITTDEINEKIKINQSMTRPSFGLAHDNNEKIVDNGFTFNNKTFAIKDNFHTPFAELPVNLGEVNTFQAKVFAERDLQVQEFLFGIPQKGDAHLAELGIEVWYGIFGEIEDIKVIQKSNVIDIKSITATHEKTKCLATDIEANCDATNISMIFLEPLEDKVMAIKAIDYKKRYQITYLNEGLDISGDSLNPMETKMIPSNLKNQGLIQITQTSKYSHLWTTEDGIIFEENDFGTFNQINKQFERFQDPGEPKTRLHSGFGGIIAYEQKRATLLFNSTEYISELPESFAYIYPENSERIDDKMREQMLNEEKKCLKYLDDTYVQARY